MPITLAEVKKRLETCRQLKRPRQWAMYYDEDISRCLEEIDQLKKLITQYRSMVKRNLIRFHTMERNENGGMEEIGYMDILPETIRNVSPVSRRLTRYSVLLLDDGSEHIVRGSERFIWKRINRIIEGV